MLPQDGCNVRPRCTTASRILSKRAGLWRAHICGAGCHWGMMLVLPAMAMHRSERALPARATSGAHGLLVSPQCLGQPASAPHVSLLTLCPCCCHQPCLCRALGSSGKGIAWTVPCHPLGTALSHPLLLVWFMVRPVGSAPTADHGGVTDTRAVCVPQGQGVFTLLLQLRGVRVDQGGQGKFH